jgi:hypothetical protein
VLPATLTTFLPVISATGDPAAFGGAPGADACRAGARPLDDGRDLGWAGGDGRQHVVLPAGRVGGVGPGPTGDLAGLRQHPDDRDRRDEQAGREEHGERWTSDRSVGLPFFVLAGGDLLAPTSIRGDAEAEVDTETRT